MTATLKKLFIAGVISLSILGAVLYWYDKTSPQNKNLNDQKPIAFVKEIKEDVNRRPAKRQIWQSVYKGEPVFSGESIRTSKESEVQIEFVDGSKSILIEPESIIMLVKKSNQELSLDLMEGGASVNSSDADDGSGVGLNLVQNGKTLSLKGNASFSKSATGGLEIQGTSTTDSIIAKAIDPRLQKIKLLAPLFNKNVFTENGSSEINFSWSAIPQDIKAKIHLGTQRDQLNTIYEAELSSVKAVLKPGFYFYKIYFYNSSNSVVAESNLQKLRILERKPPLFLNPVSQQTVQFKQVKDKIVFSWTAGEFVKASQLEVSQDKNFNQKIFAQNISSFKNFEYEFGVGEYYARINTQFETEDKFSLGQPIKFNIVFAGQSNDSLIGLNLIKWENLQSPLIEVSKTEDVEQQLFAGSPTLQLKWRNEIGQKISQYKIKIIDNANPSAKPLEFKQSALITSAKIPLTKGGRYVASVQGLNEQQKVVANSTVKIIEALELKLPEKPEILSKELIEAEKNGNLPLQWKASEGAVSYLAQIINKKGQIVIQKKLTPASELKTVFEELMPGDYVVQVAGVDLAQRQGPFDKKKVKVPNESDLAAPKIKVLKVK